jgi:hypothetical protein
MPADARPADTGPARAVGPGLDHTEIARFSELLGGTELRAPEGVAATIRGCEPSPRACSPDRKTSPRQRTVFDGDESA